MNNVNLGFSPDLKRHTSIQKGDVVMGKHGKIYIVGTTDGNKYNLVSLQDGNHYFDGAYYLSDLGDLISSRGLSVFRNNELNLDVGTCIMKKGDFC